MLAGELRAVWLAQLEAVSGWISIAGAKLGCRDPDDDKVLETALMGEADCLVTGAAPRPFGHVSISRNSGLDAGALPGSPSWPIAREPQRVQQDQATCASENKSVPSWRRLISFTYRTGYRIGRDNVQTQQIGDVDQISEYGKRSPEPI